MIRRLVQNQNVRGRVQDGGKGQAGLLASAQAPDGLEGQGADQSESTQELTDLVIVFGAALFVVVLLLIVDVKVLDRGFVEVVSETLDVVLRHVGDFQGRMAPEVSGFGIRGQFAAQELHERRFSGPVLSQKPMRLPTDTLRVMS